MRPYVASTLVGFVLCQVALIGFVSDTPERDDNMRRGLLEVGNQTLTASQIRWLLSTVEELKGTTEAQQATIAELQREAFFAADARAEELLDANSTVLNATRAVIEPSEILAGLDDDQCTVMSNGDSAENATELAEFIEEEVAATDR